MKSKLDKNELKIKAYQNSSSLVNCNNEKVKVDTKVCVGYDYEATPMKKKTGAGTKSNVINHYAPHILKNVKKPLFKATTVDLDEEMMVIKQQLCDEDKAKKLASSSSVDEKPIQEEIKPKSPVKPEISI